MKARKFLKDIIYVIFSNGIVLVSGAVVALVIPKYTGIREFGEFKLFTLYITYTSLLHFGFVDGILLIYAGEKYSSLDKHEFRLNSKFFFLFQMVIMGIILLIGYFFSFSKSYLFVMLIALDSLLINLTTYFQFIAQATMNFKQLSIRNIFQAFLRILVVLILVELKKTEVIGEISSTLLIISWVIIDLCLTALYILSYRDIVFGPSEQFRSGISRIKKYFLIGLPLTFSYQLSTLTYNLDNQFVSIFFSVTVYGLYAFAYSLMSLVNVVILAISMVLLPNLKKESKKELVVKLGRYLSIMAVIVFAGISTYYPLKIIITIFLPNYVKSFEFLKVIFPGLGFTSAINAIIFTYYQVFGKIKLYFKIGIVVFILSLIMNYVSLIVWNSPQSISIVSIFILLIWYILAEIYFIKRYHIRWIKNLLYNLFMIISFYVSVSLNNVVFALIVYIFLYISITVLLFYNNIKVLLCKIK